jgi:cytochrome c-type biogenesis protein CcmH
MMFLLFSVTLSVVVVLLLLLPLFSKEHHQDEVERRKVNVESARTRLAEIEQELKNADINQEQFDRYRLEIETSVAEDLRDLDKNQQTKAGGNRVIAVSVALIVPVLSIVIYRHIGSEQALMQPELQQAQQSQSAELDMMLASVEREILNDPDEVEGRIALGQVYAELERYSDAAMVYGQLNQIQPDDADILVNYAEALGRSHGNRLEGRPLELLNQALSVNPSHGRGLWLAGFAEMQSENRERALVHWRQLLAGMELGSEAYKRVEDLIRDVESEQGANETQVAGDAQGMTSSLKVSVALAEGLERQFDPHTTLFIFARAAEGPPMPLAVHRGLAKDLPLTVTLDDSMAMMPNMSLSGFPNVVVGARLSSNGQPQGQSGDFEGYSGVVGIHDDKVVSVLIDSIKP